MGDVAEMMLDGILCEGCGVYLETDEAAHGFPQLCEDCAEDRRQAGRTVRETGFGTWQDTTPIK